MAPMSAPDTQAMQREEAHMEDTPAYAALKASGLICTKYRRKDVTDIFTGGRTAAAPGCALATLTYALAPRFLRH